MRTFAAASLIVLIFRAGFLSAQTASSTPPAAFVEVDGSRLYYEECGTGQKAVLLLHDGVVNSAVWDDVWPTFCKQFHAIRYDRRGYGRSPATKKPYYEADDVAALLLDRKVSQAVLVASSHGGNIALSFALRYPAQVIGLVLIGPEAEGFPYSEHFAMSQVAFQNAKDPIEVRVQNTYLIVPGNDAAREHLRRMLRASPQDHKHNDMPLPEKPVFPYVRDLRGTCKINRSRQKQRAAEIRLPYFVGLAKSAPTPTCKINPRSGHARVPDAVRRLVATSERYRINAD